MKTSDAGLLLIKQFESVKLKAYKCPAGVWTIGVGHTSAAGPPKVSPGMVISPQEADRILRADVADIDNDMSWLIKVELTQNQWDAIASWTFNCGVGALQKSTLLKRINAKQFDKVPAELMKWTKGGGKELPGLVRRRRAEAKLWRDIDESVPIDHEESRATPEIPSPPKSMLASKEGNAAIVSGVAAAAGAAEVAKQVSETATTFGELLKNPVFIALVVVAALAGAIWYWRKKRNDEEGA